MCEQEVHIRRFRVTGLAFGGRCVGFVSSGIILEQLGAAQVIFPHTRQWCLRVVRLKGTEQYGQFDTAESDCQGTIDFSMSRSLESLGFALNILLAGSVGAVNAAVS